MYIIDRLKRRKTGFTFIEIVFVVSLVAVVSFAVYSVFSQGINIWQRLAQEAKTDEINIFCERISTELRNSFLFTGIDFTGTEYSISFPGLVLSRLSSGESQEMTVGRINYSFDIQDKVLNRRQSDYSQVFQLKYTPWRQVLSGVKNLKFKYYYYNPKQGLYLWKDLWEGPKEVTALPLAVRVEIGFDKDVRIKTVTRTITIPAGG